MPDDENSPSETEFINKSEFSKPLLVQTAIQKCLEARSKEMRAGYTNHTVSNGVVRKEEIPDTRQVFISCVQALRFLLHPEIEKDKDKISKIFCENADAEEKEIFNKNAIPMETVSLSKTILILKDKKYIPVNDEVIYRSSKGGKTGSMYSENILIPCKGLYNNIANTYWKEMIVLYDKIFQELNSLTERLDYFGQKTSY